MPGVELPMSVSEYDTILRSIDGKYGSDIACILADRFDECDMPHHAAICRMPGVWLRHPWTRMYEYRNEDVVAMVHYILTECTDRPNVMRELLRLHGVMMHPESTIENPILDYAK